MKARIECAEVLERADEQACANQQEQRQRYLRRHEGRTQSPSGDGDSAGARDESGSRRDARRRERRRHPKEQARRHGDEQCESEHVSVRRHVEHDRSGASARKQRDEHAACHLRECQTDCRTCQGQERALGQQLSDDPAAAGADGETNGHLPLSRRGAREQEVSDVDAGDHEHHDHESHHHEERLSKLLPQRGPSGRAWDDFNPRRQDPAPRRRHGRGHGGSRELRPYDRQAGLGLDRRDAGARPRQDAKPGRARLERLGTLRVQLRQDAERQRDVGRLANRRSREAGRTDADNGHGHALYQQRTADHGIVTRERTLPVAVADDGRGNRSRPIVVAHEEPADGRPQSERFVERATHPGGRRAHDRVGRSDVERRVAEPAHVRKHVPLIGQTAHERIRETVPAFSAGQDHRHLHQLLRVAHRKGAEQQRLNEAEDRRVRANAERERQDRDECEPGRSAQRSRRVQQIAPRIVQPPERSRVALMLFGLLDAADCASRGVARFVGRHPSVPILVLQQREVGGDLAREFPLAALGPNDAEEPEERPPHDRPFFFLLRVGPHPHALMPPTLRATRLRVWHGRRRYDSLRRSLSTSPASRRQRAVCRSSARVPVFVMV